MKNKHITLGIVAHVDAGKTTLSEAVLYLTGAIRKVGRVDHGDAFLDNDEIERERGITVFAKEARFRIGEKEFTLLDTPGHSDFGSETERSLQVLDYAILVVSGADGVQAHTLTLWKLLAHYEIPTFVFVNKMDQPTVGRNDIIAELSEQLGGGIFADFGKATSEIDDASCRMRFCEPIAEEIAATNELLMSEYFESSSFCEESIIKAIKMRELFPVFFGSALKSEGVAEFLDAFERLSQGRECGEDFGARVYKIGRDKQGNRLTYLRVTGGSLRNKTVLESGEKIEQLRIYNGESFQSVQSVQAGTVCAALGPVKTYAGQGLGCEKGNNVPMLSPMLSYEIVLPQGQDPLTALQNLRQLEEEEPSLRLSWNKELRQIHAEVMGELELEVLNRQIARRFDMEVSFGEGGILYKETIAKPVIGIGHYEPLRHYAEVQLLIEPLPTGSGLVFDSLVSEDKFARNWQRLVLTHLAEKAHKGVLIGAEITDMKISIAAGHAHPKHTEGGDFRQATYRALRQGLRAAEGVLLEPMYAFSLRLPQEAVGRALTDLMRLGAKATLEAADLITGTGPAATLKDYAKDVAVYTKGKGILSLMPAGYMPCHNQEEVIAASAYRADSDLENPTGSVFCEHGAACYVNWEDVPGMAHLTPEIRIDENGKVKAASESASGACSMGENSSGGSVGNRYKAGAGGVNAGNDELEAIFLRTYGKSKRDEAIRRANMSRVTQNAAATAKAKQSAGSEFKHSTNGSHNTMSESRKGTAANANRPTEKPLFVIDGYNVIFAWEELLELARVNIDSAREALIDTIGNYMGYREVDVVLVFDGYKLAGNPGEKTKYGKVSETAGELQVVYTKEAQTADRFIEKTVYEFGKKRRITVVTSDRPVQMAALGDGAARMSAREFYAEVESTNADIRHKLLQQSKERNLPFAELSDNKNQ